MMGQACPRARLLLDANINILVYFGLRDRCYDVEWLTGTKREWLNDQLIRYAIRERRILLTHDKEFHEGLPDELVRAASVIILDVHPGSIRLLTDVLEAFLDDAIEILRRREASVVLLSPDGVKKVV